MSRKLNTVRMSGVEAPQPSPKIVMKAMSSQEEPTVLSQTQASQHKRNRKARSVAAESRPLVQESDPFGSGPESVSGSQPQLV